jgi:small subunit ribosomal protein S9
VAAIVQYLGTGRRKRSVARVFLRPGKGEIKVNNRPFENYFPTESARAMVRGPLSATETMDKFDLLILADGGGVAGQAGAARMGIARALVEVNGTQAVPVLQTVVSHGRGAAVRGLFPYLSGSFPVRCVYANFALGA